MKLLLPAIVLVATIAAQNAWAELERRDSSQFAYKYEMISNPTNDDLNVSGVGDFTGWSTAFSLGSGQDVGSIKIDASSNGKYLISNQEVGTVGDGWRSLEASSTSGFTIEARVKITECTGANGAICLEAGPSDSKVYARLNFFTDKIVWNGTTLTNMVTTGYHTYRIARAGGTAVHSVWVDGVLVAQNLGTGFTYNNSTLYRCLLGSPGTGWTGKAQVAWLRFDKGAYAPIDEKAYVKVNRLLSDEFDVKYEMADDDALVPLSGSSSDWKTGGSGATIAKANGVLSVTTAGKSVYWDTTDTAWKSLVTAATPFTAEFRVKINASTQSGADRAFNFLLGTPKPVGQLFVGMNCVQWCLSTSTGGTYVTLDTSDNSDGFHTFRIAYDGATRHGFTVWRDGVVIGKNLVDCTNFYNYSGNALGIVRFGKAGGLNDGSWDLDYVRWKIGGVYPPDNRKGMIVILF